MRYCRLATPKSWLSRQLTPRYSWPAVCRVWRFSLLQEMKEVLRKVGSASVISRILDSPVFLSKRQTCLKQEFCTEKIMNIQVSQCRDCLYYVLYRTDTGKFQNCQSTIVDTKIFVVQPRFRWHSLAASLKLFSTSYLFHYSETNTALTPKFRSYKISRNVCLKTL